MIESGYDLLREAGKDLDKEGVAFHDLSRTFAAESGTLYVDNCCHFNAEGNRILARAMADIVGGRPDVGPVALMGRAR